MAETKTTVTQKMFLLGLGILITLTFCELALRLGGWTFDYLQDLRNNKYLYQKNLYTIMCIGESSTALGGENSYPSTLERMLNQDGGPMTYRVVNAGKPSVQSEYILENLEGQIKKYHPDMVLAMVGINDDIYGHMDYYNAVSKVKWYHFYKFLKIYGLYSYFKDSFVNYFNQIKIKRELALKKEVNVPVKESPVDVSGLDDISRFKYSHELVEKAFILRTQMKQQEAFELYKQAIEVYPKDVRPYMEYINALSEIHDKETVKDVYQWAITNNPQSDWGYAGLSNYYRRKNKTALADELLNKAIACRKAEKNSVLINNYRAIRQIIENHKIKLICVQYPMREVDALKRIFEHPESMVFVDNEKIFKDAVAKFGYFAIFGDTAAGDFGHCTAKGNALLAGNIKKVVLTNLK